MTEVQEKVVVEPAAVEQPQQQPEQPPQVVYEQQKVHCSNHLTDNYNNFCKDCQQPICSQCTLSIHKTHNMIEVSLEDFTNKLNIFKTLEVEVTDRADEKAYIQSLLQKLEENNKSAKSFVQERFKELQFLIKQREMNLEKEIQTLYESSKLELTKRLNIVDKDLSLVQPHFDKSKPYSKSTPNDLYNTKKFEVLEQYSMSDKRLRQIETSDYHHVKAIDVPVDFQFDLDQAARKQISDFVSSAGSITPVKKSTSRPSRVTPATAVATVSSTEIDDPKKSSGAAPKKTTVATTVANNSQNGGFKSFFSMGGWNDNGIDQSLVFKYDIEKNEWKYLNKSSSNEPLPFITSSIVSDGKYIYVFGGNYEIATYRRFNISKQSWDKPEKMNRGGAGIAAQYDGKKFIYVFGGKVLDDSKPYHQIVQRIERFNTSTKQFEYMTAMSKHKYSIFTCYDGVRYIYLVGGQVVNGRACKEIERYDIQENKSSIYASLGGGGLVQGCIIDNTCESIYYITQTVFKKFTIQSKSFEILAFPPLSETTCRPTLIYDFKSKIYLFDQYDNYCYDIPTGKWTKFHHSRRYPICGQGLIGSMV